MPPACRSGDPSPGSKREPRAGVSLAHARRRLIAQGAAEAIVAHDSRDRSRAGSAAVRREGRRIEAA
jgi:hypothetical protein